MNKDKLISALRQMQALVSECLAAAGSPRTKARRTRKGDSALEATTNALPSHIIKIRGQGYFREPRTAGEVKQKLAPTYRCETNRVAMALLRLNERKELRKASKVVGKKKQVAYVW